MYYSRERHFCKHFLLSVSFPIKIIFYPEQEEVPFLLFFHNKTQSVHLSWTKLTFDMTGMVLWIWWRYSLRYTVKKVAVATAFPAALHPHPTALGSHTVQQVDNSISTTRGDIFDQGINITKCSLWYVRLHFVSDNLLFYINVPQNYVNTVVLSLFTSTLPLADKNERKYNEKEYGANKRIRIRHSYESEYNAFKHSKKAKSERKIFLTCSCRLQ